MILSDLLRRPVVDESGTRLGRILDVRFVLDGPPDGLLASPRVHGVLVHTHRAASWLGYERTDMKAPRLIARYLRWRNRDTFLVLWPDIASISADAVTLRRDAQHWSPKLPS